jgi:chromate transporter
VSFGAAVYAAAVALIALVGLRFVGAVVFIVPDVILSVLSAVLVFRYKINSTWLVLGGAASGILLRMMGWS